jgi:hypothetical protein
MTKRKRAAEGADGESAVEQGPAAKMAKVNLADRINGPSESMKLLPRNADDKKVGERVVVVLEKAFLELVMVKKGQYQLLNCDDHKTILSKNRSDDLAEARPDITHQCLMTLLDSPLNKAGKNKKNIFFCLCNFIVYNNPPAHHTPWLYILALLYFRYN